MSNEILGGWALGNALGNAARPTDALGAELARRERARDEKRQSDLEASVGNLKHSSHMLKAKLNAHVETEAELFAQLNEAAVSIPLGNKDAFLDRATEKFYQIFFDKKVIGATFENKVLPNESVWAVEKYQEKVVAGTAKVKWHTDDYLENK